VRVFELENAHGIRAKLLDWGATLAALEVPGRDGRRADVVLGFDDPERYREPHPHLGCTVGRCANRIADARFRLAGREFRLAANRGSNHLHGGEHGFHARFWQAESFQGPGTRGVRFRYRSVDGEEGYPGNLDVEVRYSLNDADELGIEYRAETDAPTVVNLTHHSYFNLEDGGASDVLGHRLRICAAGYTEVDAAAIPSGEIVDVTGTPLDFRQPKPIGADIGAMKGDPGGYDHNFVLSDAEMGLAATLAAPRSGRRMEVWTSQPGIQLYTSNFLDGTLVGRRGMPYRKHAAVCLEAQHFPDSPNQPRFPTIELHPGGEYRHQTIHRFAVE
jgi:aldose 1-epimerase